MAAGLRKGVAIDPPFRNFHQSNNLSIKNIGFQLYLIGDG